MEKTNIKEGEKKIKFYDRSFLVSIILIILSLIIISFSPLSDSLTLFEIIGFILFLVGLLLLTFFAWCMIYWKFKNKNYFWLGIDFLLFLLSFIGLVGLVHISCFIFYFTIMRKRFKKFKE